MLLGQVEEMQKQLGSVGVNPWLTGPWLSWWRVWIQFRSGLADYGLWPKPGPPLAFINKVLLEHRQSCEFWYCLWLCSRYNGRVKKLWWRPCTQPSLKCLLSGFLRKSLLPPLSATGERGGIFEWKEDSGVIYGVHWMGRAQGTVFLELSFPFFSLASVVCVKCSIICTLLGGTLIWFIEFADFYGVNTPTTADFKLLGWGHWMHIWKRRVQSAWEPLYRGPVIQPASLETLTEKSHKKLSFPWCP